MSQQPSKIRPGSGGVCEAVLYRFREYKNIRERRIAAENFTDAYKHLIELEPDFRVFSVKALGLIRVVSGSPFE